jgi:hypothetical protein
MTSTINTNAFFDVTDFQVWFGGGLTPPQGLQERGVSVGRPRKNVGNV